MVKEAVIFTLNNRYFTVHGLVFRQIIVIAFELRPAPFFVDFSFLLKRVVAQLELINSRKFSKAFRFIDDEDILTFCGEIEQYISE